MLPKPLRAIWGNLSSVEVRRFGLLSLALMLTVGPYWMLRSVREALFIDLVGVTWQPWGKMLSFLFVIPLVLIYSKLIDLVCKEKLFYVIYSAYVAVFLFIAFAVAYDISLPFSSFVPGKSLGWVSYVIFESFIALTLALFWSFVARHTTTASAKRGYGMILSITQIGTIGGSFFVAQFSQTLGLPLIIACACIGISCVPFIITKFLQVDGEKPKTKTNNLSKKKTGFWEGLRLLVKHPYLLGIFVITTGYEIIGIMFEFQMNLLAHQIYPTKELFAAFFARYGMCVNGLTLAFALLGTSFFLRKFGLRVCLLLFPIGTGFIIIAARIFPILPVLFISMVILKGLSYSLNNPAKEILYIPTTSDIKFKAKGWIDIFGIRSVKASGASINAFFRNLAPFQTIAYSTPILLAIVTLWIIIARRVSLKNHDLVEKNEIIG